MSSIRASLPRPAFRAAHLQTASRRRPAPSARLVVRANIGKYLGEAAASIFSPTQDTVPWGGSSFTGDITHHEDLPRLRRLHDAIVSTRQQVAGCTDPDATNFNPQANLEDGTCTYVFEPEGAEKYKGTVGGFISQTLASVWGSNFEHKTDSDHKPANFENTTYTWGGDKVSQRDITRLLEFEKVVKSTLDKAEKEAK